MFIMKNFFESIPVAVEEAARIDGAGTFRTFWSVVLLMARPAVMTIVTAKHQGSWERAESLHRLDPEPAAATTPIGVASLASGQLVFWATSSPATGGLTADDHPGRDRVLRAPVRKIMNASTGGEGGLHGRPVASRLPDGPTVDRVTIASTFSHAGIGGWVTRPRRYAAAAGSARVQRPSGTRRTPPPGVPARKKISSGRMKAASRSPLLGSSSTSASPGPGRRCVRRR